MTKKKGNPNPDTSGLAPPFKKGQSGNPGGKTAEQRRLEIENAERATRLRARLLEQVEAGEIELTSDILRLLKDSEERGFGAPKQEIELEDKRDLADKLRAARERTGKD